MLVARKATRVDIQWQDGKDLSMKNSKTRSIDSNLILTKHLNQSKSIRISARNSKTMKREDFLILQE
jgi:hypothetical protein